MARTNIDIDEEIVARVMARYNLPTKRAAVGFALRQVARPPVTIADIDALRGAWKEGGETRIPGSAVPDWPADSDPGTRPGAEADTLT